MATTTTFSPTHVETRLGRSLLRRILDGLVKAREAEARRRIAQSLWSYDDAMLTQLGLTREELARWHAGSAD